MIRSALLRRVYAVVLMALLLMVASMWLLFMLTSQSMFVNLRVKELLPRAQSLSGIVSRYLSGDIDESFILSLVDVSEDDTSIMNAYLVVADSKGEIVLASDAYHTLDLTSISGHLGDILAGKTLVYVASSARVGDIVTLGVPVYADDARIIGAMLLYVPQYETLAARSALASSLAASVAVAAPLVILLVYLMVYRLVAPLRQMRDVALRMADGRFDRLADERISGEIGQLGGSLNRLSRTLKHNLSALTFERNRLVQILNGLSEGIAAVDQLGNLTHINPSLEGLFPVDDKSADPRMRVIPRGEIWKAFDEAVEGGKTSDFCVRQGERDIRCAISPVHDDSGAIAGAVGLFRDISNEVRLENTRREYVANVSHEMRTPLTAMRGLIEPLRDGLVTSEDAKKRYYDIILREVLRLSRLISDLMELSRLQSGTMAIAPEKFSIGEIIADLEERYAAIAAEHSLKLSVDADFEAFPPLFSNPDRVEQLLVILLDNAIKYTPAGGTIAIDGEFDDARAILRVRDTGMGIPESNLPHVFERFYKVDKAHSGLGSGLGLSIAREMLEQMGERIWAKSREGEGSEFSFTVKRAGQAPANEIAKAMPPR